MSLDKERVLCATFWAGPVPFNKKKMFWMNYILVSVDLTMIHYGFCSLQFFELFRKNFNLPLRLSIFLPFVKIKLKLLTKKLKKMGFNYIPPCITPLIEIVFF